MGPLRRTRSRGLPLIELLVVTAIIAVPAGLLRPATPKVRGTATKIKTQNRVKQIAPAAHNFHETRDSVPHAG